MPRAGACAVLLAVVASLLTACGQGGGPGAGATDGTSGKPGSARLLDDTGRPEVPDGGGWVALVPADRITELWQAAGTDPGDDLTYAAVPVTREQVAAVGGVARTVSDTGEFDLGPTGPVVV